jgi:diguanylate cyclase (GGDEF)-like protein
MATTDQDAADHGLRATEAGLRPAAALLTVLYALYTVLHAVLTPPAAVPLMVALSGTTAAVTGAVWRRQSTRPLPSSWAPHVAGGLGALVMVNSAAHLVVTGEVVQASNLMLALVGIVALVPDLRWVAATVLGAVGAYAATVAATPHPSSSHFAIGLLSAVLLGVILRAVYRAGLQALERARRDAADLATTDALTGLLNRHGLDVVGQQVLSTARRMKLGLLVLFIDLDGLKEVNDTRGHAAGDAVLVESARQLGDAFREADGIARVGGDEFVVLLMGADADDAPLLAERARRAVTNASVGTAVAADTRSTSLGEMIATADARMYADKCARRSEATA